MYDFDSFCDLCINEINYTMLRSIISKANSLNSFSFVNFLSIFMKKENVIACHTQIHTLNSIEKPMTLILTRLNMRFG